MVHRIASSGRYFAQPHQIESEWSYEDVMQAHDMLDMYDDLEVLRAR
jgi:hypothetical protein